ncbi:MAG: TetR/AcrR family transcriptional regulator [Anaerolineales bacterium]|nr:TetR/AcrR family transcriptional regulator [Anaerolineales bacterium]
MLDASPAGEKLDPRVKRTRALIQKAFGELLAEKGFRDITVQDITERAEVNRATFYAHYPDKYALLEENIAQSFRAELEKRTLSACHYSPENLRALIETVCEFVAYSHNHCKSAEQQFDSLVEGQVRLQVQTLLELWLEKLSPNPQDKLPATAATWAIYGLALAWSHQKNRPPAREFATQVLGLVAGNLNLSHQAEVQA